MSASCRGSAACASIEDRAGRVAQPEPVGELGVVDGAHRSRAHSLRVGGDDRRDVAEQRRDLMETSMFYDGGWGWFMGGMHLLWWLFWIAVVAALVWVIRARPREPRPGEPAAPREATRPDCHRVLCASR